MRGDTMHYIHKEIKEPFRDGIEIGMELNNTIKNPSLMILLTSLTKKEEIEDLINGLKTHVNVNNLIGCTTAGEFSDGMHTRHGALLVAFDRKCKASLSCKKIDKSPKQVGIELANDIKEKLKEKYPKIDINEKFFGIIFHDWKANHENEIVNALAEKLSFPIIGGTAGEALKFKNTYQIYQDKVLTEHVVLATISTKRKMEILYGHGYEPTECYARITKASGNVIYELDGKPAYIAYRDMISKVSGISVEVLEKYKPYEGRNLDFTILYPLGIQDVYGNYRISFLKSIDGNNLIFSHEVREGTFLVLMSTSPKMTMDSLYKEIFKLRKFKKPLAFIIECVARDMIKNPSMYKDTFVSHDFERWVGDYESNTSSSPVCINCIGFCSYGESIVKDIMRFHNTLTFVGVAFDLEDEYEINWKEALKYFDFSDEEIMVITELMNSNLSAKELLNKLDISQTKLYATLNSLEEKGIIKAHGKKPKRYYVDDIKSILEKVDTELESQYQFKKRKRNEFLLNL
jgi:predicted transcriptional regulator